MTIHVPSERQVIQEAAQVLIQHLSPAKATRFWASWQVGEGDYPAIREQLIGCIHPPGPLRDYAAYSRPHPLPQGAP